MRRGWLAVALLVSLGVNLGLLAAAAGGWWAAREAPASEAPGEAPSPPPAWDGPAPAGDVPPDEELGPLPGPPGAGRHGLPGAGRNPPPVERLADHLGLEGERRERFLELQRELFRNVLESRRDRARLAAELHRELAAPRPDEARVEALVGELGALYAAGERRTAEAILASRALLDDDQQRRYLQVLRRLHGGGRHGPGGGPGPGRRPRRFGPG